MRIAIIAPSPIPFVVGGAEKLWWGMQRYLNEMTTHSCELLKIPVKEGTVVDLLNAYYQFFTLDLGSYDRVISTKYPAFMVQHPDHHLYLQHLLRGCYDTYPSGLPANPPWAEPAIQRLLCTISRNDIELHDIFSELFSFVEHNSDDPHFNQFPGPVIRSILHLLDRRGMEGIKRFSAISQTVKNRLEYFPPAAAVTVIHHPSNLTTLTSRNQNYLFTASRLDGPKRIDLLINGYMKSATKLPFLIAGTGPQQENLKQLAAGDSRIRFLGFVSDKELEGYYADATAVLYAPYDEDYGLITIEALACGKPVITCHDAGGVNEFIRDGINGFVAEPDADSLAIAIDALPQLPQDTLVETCRETVQDISWKRLLDYLVADEPITVPGEKNPVVCRKQIVVVSSYPVHPAQAGGQLRLYHLLRRLSCCHNIVLLSLGGKERLKKNITPHFTEYVIPETPAFDKEKKAIENRLGISAADIAFMCHDETIPEFSQQFRQHVDFADMVICAQPYVYPLVHRFYHGLLFYDSQNMEYLMKTKMVKQQDEKLLQCLFDTEQALCRAADLTIVCAEEDVQEFMQTYKLDNFHHSLLPNGVDVAGTPYLSPEQRRKYKQTLGIDGEIALFIGSAHQPNVEAVKEVLTIATQLPQIQFIIIGSVAQAFIPLAEEDAPGSTTASNVGFTGVLTQQEKSIYLQLADISLNPMKGGSGSNLKLAEYIAAGIPVVTTPFGARGYRAELIAEIDVVPLENFVQRIVTRLDDPDRLRLLNARTEITNSYDWDAIVKNHIF